MQLALDISLNQEVTFDNFCWQGNELLQAALLDISGDSERFIYLWGSKGLGKSHILQARTAESHEPACYLPLADVCSYGVESIDGLEQLSLICLDDIDAIAGDKAFEEAIFHLYNKVRDSGDKTIVISGELAPTQLPIQLPDLRSRLAWGLVYQMQPLSDEASLRVLMLRAKEKGLKLDENVAQYLITHTSRDMANLIELIQQLDKASLLHQRRLTIPFVKEVLASKQETNLF